MDELRADVAIIGAGPAGSTLAALLAGAGVNVVVVDRETFPRDKVCGEFLSWDALPVLEQIGVLEEIDRNGAQMIDRCQIMLRGRAYEFSFPASARGISRRTLDETILDRARVLGASTLEGWSVTRVEPREEDPGFLLARNRAGDEMKIIAGTLVGAWGRWGRLDIQMQRKFARETRRRHFGFKRHYASRTDDARTIRLYPFRHGYLGASPIEGGRTNVCGLVHQARMREMEDKWHGLVKSLRAESGELDDLFAGREPAQKTFLSSEPVIFTAREPVLDGMLLIGDSAGIIDPLTGNGMAMAIQSALLAAGSIAQRLSGGRFAEMSGRIYSKHYAEWFESRIRWSRRSASILSRPRLLEMIGRLAPEPRMGEYFAKKTRADLTHLGRMIDAWKRAGGVGWGGPS
ncbi:MAG: NAD(P)/FAD-dependent oxidoreductase [Thermoanaerobaculia bacterium]|nr:NAD(P)/FAD-dependent oxidoreductase [Thermoanaerobaculia bacterium]